MKKGFLILLTIVLLFSFSACENNESPRDNTPIISDFTDTPSDYEDEGSASVEDNTLSDYEDDETSPSDEAPIVTPLGVLSNDGYGRTRFYANGMGLAAGDLVSDILKEGFTVTKDLSTLLGPKECVSLQFEYTTKSGTDKTLSTSVVNETDFPRAIENCRVYYLLLSTSDADMTVEGGTALTPEYIESTYHVTEDSYETTFGKPLNFIEIDPTNRGYLLTAVCIDYLYPTYDISATVFEQSPDDANACAMLSQYMDVSSYVTGENTSGTLTSATLTDTLSFTIEGQSITLGMNGTTVSSLRNRGWSFDTGDLNSHLGAISYRSSGSPIFNSSSCYNVTTDKQTEIDCLRVANFTATSTTVSEGRLVTVDLFCNNYYAWSSKTNTPADFDFYGITSSSTIQNIIDRFGNPKSIESGVTMNMPILWYEFTDKDNITYQIAFSVDSLLNTLCNIQIRLKPNAI